MDSLTQKSLTLFNRWASVYDSPVSRWFFDHYYRKVEAHLDDLNGKHLLSVGCGTGTLEIRLARTFSRASIVGIDFSEKMLARADAKKGTLDNVRFQHSVAESLDLPDRQFDVITCIHSFHHYADQLESLREFRRVLKPGGTLLLLDGIRDDWRGRLHLKLNMLLYEPGVLYHHSRGLIRLIRAAGFEQVERHRLDPVYSIFECR
jgi:ubiquinone/menaquinone biosynthesis C-methylase UbiE